MRDVVWFCDLADGVAIEPMGVFGCRRRPGVSWSIVTYEGRIDVHDDPLPPLDLDDEGRQLTPQDEWWLRAAVFWACPIDAGMAGSFGNLDETLQLGVQTLCSERSIDLFTAGLAETDAPLIAGHLCQRVLHALLLVTEPDPLLAWATTSANAMHRFGMADSPLELFNQIVLAELLAQALDRPVDDPWSQSLVEQLHHLARQRHDERSMAYSTCWHTTTTTVLKDIFADAELASPSHLAPLEKVLTEHGVPVELHCEVREAVLLLAYSQLELRWMPLNEGLQSRLGFSIDRYEAVVRRVCQL